MKREEEGLPGMGKNVLGGRVRVSLGKSVKSWKHLESLPGGSLGCGESVNLF